MPLVPDEENDDDDGGVAKTLALNEMKKGEDAWMMLYDDDGIVIGFQHHFLGTAILHATIIMLPYIYRYVCRQRDGGRRQIRSTLFLLLCTYTLRIRRRSKTFWAAI